MRILHTADWHLGRRLYGQNRYLEFEQFLDWLLEAINEQRIDMLLVAGDIFDTTIPSNRAQELYYGFLARAAQSCCQHVVIIGGNHDSPSFLAAPQRALSALNVHLVAAISEDLADEVLVLDLQGKPAAIICAVPYLRDKDLRTVQPGESFAEKNAKLLAGLEQHYADVCAIAEQRRAELAEAGHPNIPLIAMGHLFTTRGKTTDDDGVRELYVGSLARVGKECFPDGIDYLALGHLHIPQSVGGAANMRYSGSPIPMGYGESKQQKQVVILEFEGTTPQIQTLSIPCFQRLERIHGESWETMQTQLLELTATGEAIWLEIEYAGAELLPNLPELVAECVQGSALEVQLIKNRSPQIAQLIPQQSGEVLASLDPEQILTRRFDAAQIPEEQREELLHCYREILQTLQEADPNAE